LRVDGHVRIMSCISSKMSYCRSFCACTSTFDMTTSSVPAPSTIFFALHIVLLHPHVYLAIKHKTFRFLFLLGTGIVLEVAGQIFHTLHRKEPFTSCATIFFCAAIHSVWVQIVGVCIGRWEAYERFFVAELVASCVAGGGAVATWKGYEDVGEAMAVVGMGWFAGSIVVLSGVLWCCSFQEEMESAKLLKGIDKFHGGELDAQSVKKGADHDRTSLCNVMCPHPSMFPAQWTGRLDHM
jgi:hypothetical protein